MFRAKESVFYVIKQVKEKPGGNKQSHFHYNICKISISQENSVLN